MAAHVLSKVTFCHEIKNRSELFKNSCPVIASSYKPFFHVFASICYLLPIGWRLVVWYDFSNKTPPLLCCCLATSCLFKLPSSGYACELQETAPPHDQTTSIWVPNHDEYFKVWKTPTTRLGPNLKVVYTTPSGYPWKPAGVIYKKVFSFEAY